MKFKIFTIVLGIGLLFSACQKDEPVNNLSLDSELEQALKDASGGAGKAGFRLPFSTEFSKIPQDPRNPITQQKINLGALLFHETGIALNPKHPEHAGMYSCASCHFASAGFQAGRHQGISDGGLGFGINGEGRVPDPLYDLKELDVQPVRSPSALNIAYQEAILWNGQFGAVGVNAGTEASWTAGTPKEVNHLGYQGTESQAIAAQDVHRLKMNDDVCEELGYRNLFDAAFPDVDKAVRYDREHAGLAIAAYERSILANQAPFQLWLNGNSNAMTAQEKEGAILFFGKANCASCHNGPSLANMEFYALGMKDLFENQEATYGTDANSNENQGRFSFTKREEDKFKFKVPQLYNLADSPFYGHGSSFHSVRDVVVYKNKAVKENPNVPDSQLAEQFKPLGLSESEIDAITTFIEHGLRDPNLLRYQPLSIRSGNCFPFNDPQSRVDLGCN
ncbi:MAG: cytochrome c peroxidase [Saprospiraceae bacterium]|nr:cytochrome-c peroxidase [Saprospiraceae bacterium]